MTERPPHDYKAALESLQDIERRYENGLASTNNDRLLFKQLKEWAIYNMATIRQALLIANAVMQEPSKKMIEAGFNTPPTHPKVVFTAMRDQMLKEIEVKL